MNKLSSMYFRIHSYVGLSSIFIFKKSQKCLTDMQPYKNGNLLLKNFKSSMSRYDETIYLVYLITFLWLVSSIYMGDKFFEGL